MRHEVGNQEGGLAAGSGQRRHSVECRVGAVSGGREHAVAAEGDRVNIQISATVPLEVAHRGLDGVLHGHSLSAEVWTDKALDLDRWRERIAQETSHIGKGPLEESIRARTFEDVAKEILRVLPMATKVILHLPTLGHKVEVVR
jgi:hypothetical protein